MYYHPLYQQRRLHLYLYAYTAPNSQFAISTPGNNKKLEHGRKCAAKKRTLEIGEAQPVHLIVIASDE